MIVLSGTGLSRYCLFRVRCTHYRRLPIQYPPIGTLSNDERRTSAVPQCVPNATTCMVPTRDGTTEVANVRRYASESGKNVGNFHSDYEFPNFDYYRRKQFRNNERNDPDQKPGMTYFMGFAACLATAYAVKSEVTRFVTYMSPSADVLAMASIEVDLHKIKPGTCATYKWRGKPLFVKHRTQEDIDYEEKTPLSTLRDPQTPDARTKRPQWLLVIGICTHLGCIPIPNSGDFPGGFYCPCHGSHYDNLARARKGPAPLNLEIPPYVFINDDQILVG